MRGKQAFKNIIANILLQFILALCGLLLPRWYLITYGSEMNGAISSLTQFMTYLTLVESGIGAAAVISLYGPLADKNQDEISGVLTATQKFYNQSGILYIILIVLLTIGFPFIISDSIPDETIRKVAIILSFSNIVDYFFLGKYRALLTADQKGYVIINAQVFGTILNTLIAIWLMSLNLGIVIVKLMSTIVYIMRSLIIYGYVKINYPYIKLNVSLKENVFTERWAALIHQVAGIVLNNSNLIILTLFLGSKSLLIISVYTIYQMIASLVSNIIGSFTSSFSSGFGELIYKNEEDTLRKAYSEYEFVFIVMFVIYTCMGILFLPFVKIYTNGITDINYLRPSFAILFTLIGIFTNLRNPGITLIIAAGHYRKTQPRAIKEAAINIIAAFVFVQVLGVEGVLLGTLLAFIYSFISVLLYCNRNLIKQTMWFTCKRLIRNVLIMLILWVSITIFHPIIAVTYFEWFISAVLIGGISSIVFLVINTLAEPLQMRRIFKRIMTIFNFK